MGLLQVKSYKEPSDIEDEEDDFIVSSSDDDAPKKKRPARGGGGSKAKAKAPQRTGGRGRSQVGGMGAWAT